MKDGKDDDEEYVDAWVIYKSFTNPEGVDVCLDTSTWIIDGSPGNCL